MIMTNDMYMNIEMWVKNKREKKNHDLIYICTTDHSQLIPKITQKIHVQVVTFTQCLLHVMCISCYVYFKTVEVRTCVHMQLKIDMLFIFEV